ncbi:hypothetical protein [Marinirhabdus gelatinilytica]|uniref:Glycerophosphoryl diester phosphodiesterase family protein n=1 Tax=Marinirhabdus gelatinilytica TaxID=1703343 RepID=A0A370QM74_9FLAO|nr:hypothetical protein [Marinirhabdus gelatinilytica]RDK89120.1 hypothetical protein C8D94_1011000 [Marinirhabdus gelatinilytica]
MNNQEHPIFQRIEKAPKPDFGNILTVSFDAVKELWQPALYHGLISLIFMVPFLLLVYAPLAPFYIDLFQNMGDPYYQPEFEYPLSFWLWYTMGCLVVALLIQLFNFSLVAHFYKVIKLKDAGSRESAGGYFSYLKGNVGKILLLNVAAMVIAVVAALLCYLPIFYVMVPLQLFAVIFTFNQDLSASQIIKAAFKLGHKFWLIIFGVVLISSMIAQLGIIFCFVGVFVTQLFVHIPIYNIYKNTIGFSEISDETTIQHP